MTPSIWERWSNWPLIVTAVAFLVAYAAPIIRPSMSGTLLILCQVVVWLAWALFALDYVARLLLAEDKRRYALRHWFDLMVIALPVLRPLRLLRLLPMLAILNRRASSGLRGRVALYVAVGALLLGFCGALAVLDAERASPDANRRTFGDAVWWAITTMTTVGYGDHYPTTAVGRVAAVGLMLGGVALLGVVTATLASWLVEQVKTSERQQTDELKAEIQELQTDVDALGRRSNVGTSIDALRAALDILEAKLAEGGRLHHSHAATPPERRP